MRFVGLWLEDIGPFRKILIPLDGDYVVKSEINLVFQPQGPRPYGVMERIIALVGENGCGKTTILNAIAQIVKSDSSVSASIVYEHLGGMYTTSYDCPVTVNGSKPVYKTLSSHARYKAKAFKAVSYTPVYDPHVALHSRNRSNLVENVGSDYIYRYTKKKNKEVDFEFHFDFLSEMKKFAKEKLNFKKFMSLDIASGELNRIRRKIASVIADHSEENKFLRDLVGRAFEIDPRSLNIHDDPVFDSSAEIRNYFTSFFPTRDEKEFKRGLNIQDEINYSMLVKALDSELSIALTSSLRSKSDRLSNIKEVLSCAKSLLTSDDPSRWVKNWFSNLVAYLSPSNRFRDYPKDVEIASLLFKDLSYNAGKFPVEIPPRRGDFALRILSEIRKAKLDKYGFFAEWKGISSGQIAKLNLYSRLYSVLKNFEGESIIVLLDEGDIYLHPEWQRTFLNDFKDFLTEICQPKQIVQVILSTHSPLMISDLYRQDVYLVKKENNFSIVEMAKEETFGASIFDLYKNEFVIKRTKGEIAFLEIQNTVHKIKSEERSSDYLVSKIDRIGDRLLKIGLQNLMDTYD